jgi:hypothetical protein
MDPQKAARMLSLEVAHADAQWWRRALEVLTSCRDEEPLLYNGFIESLGTVVAGAERMELTELLSTDLSVAQRCFLLALLDIFMDVALCSGDLPASRWLANWEDAAEFVIPAGLAVQEDPSHLPAEEIEAAWRVLLACDR